MFFSEFEKFPVKRSLSHHSLLQNPKKKEMDEPLDQTPFEHCHLSQPHPTNDVDLSLQPDSLDILQLQKSDINQNKGIKVFFGMANMPIPLLFGDCINDDSLS